MMNVPDEGNVHASSGHAIAEDGRDRRSRRPWHVARPSSHEPLASPDAGHKLNYMVQFNQGHLDDAFAALSDATRRGVLLQLGRADASITHLAERFDMTLTGMKKHVSVLERAGLVTTEKVGRVRTCRLGPRRLEAETEWIESYRKMWDERFDALNDVVAELARKEKSQ